MRQPRRACLNSRQCAKRHAPLAHAFFHSVVVARKIRAERGAVAARAHLYPLHQPAAARDQGRGSSARAPGTAQRRAQRARLSSSAASSLDCDTDSESGQMKPKRSRCVPSGGGGSCVCSSRSASLLIAAWNAHCAGNESSLSARRERTAQRCAVKALQSAARTGGDLLRYALLLCRRLRGPAHHRRGRGRLRLALAGRLRRRRGTRRLRKVLSAAVFA